MTTWTTQLKATPISRAGGVIGVALLTLTTLSWAYLVAQNSATHHAAAQTPTMGMGALLFLAVWVAMMFAMMLPTVSPMILMYARIAAAQRTSGRAWTPVWLFVTGHLLLWTALGVLAYLGAVAAERVAGQVSWVDENAGRIGGALIVVAGLYQFSKLKDRCLTECRSPLAFVMEHWRDGTGGAVRMGVHHGWHCAGCCWALMAMLFPLGMMNIRRPRRGHRLHLRREGAPRVAGDALRRRVRPGGVRDPCAHRAQPAARLDGPPRRRQ